MRLAEDPELTITPYGIPDCFDFFFSPRRGCQVIEHVFRKVHEIEVDTPTQLGPYSVPTRRPAESSGERGKQFWRDLDKTHPRAQDSACKAWARNPYGPSVPA